MNAFDNAKLSSQVRSDAGIFVRQTYAYFAASLLVAAIGSIAGMGILPLLAGNLLVNILLIAVEIGLVIYLMRMQVVSAAAVALLMLFAFVSGLTLSGIIAYTLAHSGVVVLAQALFLTTLAFAGLSVYAFVSKRDFSVFGSVAFVILLLVIGASLVNLFVHSSALELAISCVCALLFSFYVIYDTQMLIRGEYRTPIQGAISLYLDFINLFVSLLRILNSLRD